MALVQSPSDFKVRYANYCKTQKLSASQPVSKGWSRSRLTAIPQITIPDSRTQYQADRPTKQIQMQTRKMLGMKEELSICQYDPKSTSKGVGCWWCLKKKKKPLRTLHTGHMVILH